MATEVVTVTVDQLRDVVRGELRSELAKLVPELVGAVGASRGKEWLTVEDAATVLGLTVAALYKRIARGARGLEVRRIGRSVRVRLAGRR